MDWNDQYELLAATRGMLHNHDYWRFLMRDVWRICEARQSVADFGCGFGWAGGWMLPLMADGSDYTGMDVSEGLLARGRAMFSQAPFATRFVKGSALAAPFADNSFDVTIAHTVLMHLADPAAALAEMIRVTRPGGLVISADTNHAAINAMVHVHETDETEKTPMGLWQSVGAGLRARTGRDRNLGMKTPVLMHQAGLLNVAARVSDAVRTSFPPLDTAEKQRAFEAIMESGLGGPRDEAESRIFLEDLVSRGVDRKTAAAELRREMGNDYRRTGRDYHITIPGLITISYGWVA